ncbi:MAG: ABC transporter permease [Lachnospiraceae bacterium]|nr:ABC transporter permease [Lachnospiraceae bacterium]
MRPLNDSSIAFLYDKEVNYDYALHYYSYAPRENNGDNTYREFYAEINGKYSKLYAMNNTDYVRIYDETNRPLELGKGIILYSKLAEELGVKAGDSVTVDGKKVTVDAVCKAVTDYKCYLSCEAYEELYGDSGCNALFVKGELPEYDDGPDSGFFYVGSVRSLQHDLESKFAYISSYILIIIGISCLICVIVIYNLSVIFYRRRIRDHMILRTLGNSYSKVLAGSLIEIILQAILALAIGIPLGYGLAAYTVHAISNDAITMYISFGDIPVVTISAFILITAIVGRIVAAPGQIRLLPKEN